MSVCVDSLYFEDMSNPESETDDDESSSEGRLSDASAVKSQLLVHSVLDCLHKTFLYAPERFVKKETFQALLQPLIDQVRVCNLPESSVHMENNA